MLISGKEFVMYLSVNLFGANYIVLLTILILDLKILSASHGVVRTQKYLQV